MKDSIYWMCGALVMLPPVVLSFAIWYVCGKSYKKSVESNKTSLIMKMSEYVRYKWMGRKVKIIDRSHPWTGETGTVKSIDKTLAGYGMRIELDNGVNCFVFKTSDISILKKNIANGEGG